MISAASASFLHDSRVSEKTELVNKIIYNDMPREVRCNLRMCVYMCVLFIRISTTQVVSMPLPSLERQNKRPCALMLQI